MGFFYNSILRFEGYQVAFLLNDLLKGSAFGLFLKNLRYPGPIFDPQNVVVWAGGVLSGFL